MTKLIDNSYRDLNFSFSNEIALMCEKANIDSYEAINAANYGYIRNSVKLPICWWILLRERSIYFE